MSGTSLATVGSFVNRSPNFLVYGYSSGSTSTPIVYSSKNGITYTTVNTGITSLDNTQGGYGQAAIGGGKLVLFPGNGNKSYASSDGINFTSGTLPGGSAVWWRGAVYGGKKYFATTVNNGNNTQAAISNDGINWTSITMPVVNENWSIYPAFWNGKFYTLGYTGNWASTADGITWSSGALPAGANNNGWAVGTSPSYVWAVSTQGTGRVMYSSNGSTWNTNTNIPNYSYTSCAYGNGRYVALERNNYAVWSTDLNTWNTVSMPSAQYIWTQVIWTGTYFVALSGNNNATTAIAYSTNGASWTQVNLGISAFYQNIGNINAY